MDILKEMKKVTPFENIDINDIKEIALKAGKTIMDIYKHDFQINYKDDKSPLTGADLKSNEIICNALYSLYPDIPLISEENKLIDYDERKNWEYYWCIDPIDGTKEFIKKMESFQLILRLYIKYSSFSCCLKISSFK